MSELNDLSAIKSIRNEIKSFQKDLVAVKDEIALLKKEMQRLKSQIKITFAGVKLKVDINEAFKKVKLLASLTRNSMQQAFINIKNISSSVFSAIKKEGKNAFLTVKKAGSTAFTTIKKVSGTIFKGIKKTGSNVFKSIRKTGTQAFKGIKKISSNLFKGVKKAGSVAFSGIKKIGSAAFKGISKTASGAFNGLKNIISSPISSALSYAKDNIGEFIDMGLKQEKHELSIKTLIEKNNGGTPASEIKKVQDDYLNQLKNNSRQTPFDTNQVMTAGTEALQMSGGDTKEAMELLKIAEDMAAINPNKSLSEAMSALKSLKSGDAASMIDFGINIDASTIESGAGIDEIIKNKVEPFFQGGVEQLSQTAGGTIDMLKGNMSSVLGDLSMSLLQNLQPALQSLSNFISSPAFQQFVTSTMVAISTGFSYIGKIFSWIAEQMPGIQEIIGGISNWIVEKFGWIGQESGFLLDVFGTAFSGMKEYAATLWKVVKPVLNNLATGVKIIFNLFKLVWPAIKSIVTAVWEKIKPIIEWVGKAYEWIGGKQEKFSNWLGEKADANYEASKSGTSELESPFSTSSGGVADIEDNPVFSDSSLGSIEGSYDYTDNSIDDFGMDYKIPESSFSSQYALPENTTYSSYEMPMTTGESFYGNSGMNSSNSFSDSNITININGVDKSTDDIVGELVPKLELALANM
ncbi:hypothetical protein [Vallitalea okinawensis]|uniref:hypothetical protein n=1 Tax=Vallitalea okinawensis TaxID=2078660 RepID=UPI000CFAF5B1|nr:hypothetical protein [Vallitalea okinawensis]